MIDKIEAMIERDTYFRKDVSELYRQVRSNPDFGGARRSKFYHAVADLRPLGFDAVLHMEQKRYGTHKVELLETGKKSMAELESTLGAIVDADPLSFRIGRIDLAADVRDVPLSWFREHAYVEYKQFLCAHAKAVDFEYSEMGKKVYQTLYFGKRPSCVRIYDKVAERVAHYELWKKRETRSVKRVWLDTVAHQDPGDREALLLPEFPSVQEWLRVQLPHLAPAPARRDQPYLVSEVAPAEQLSFPVVTRVENQFGGRVPESLETMAAMKKNVCDFNPFLRVRTVTGKLVPPGLYDVDAEGCYRFGVLEWFAGMAIREKWEVYGAQQMRNMLNRDRHGSQYLKKFWEFIPLDDEPGITSPELFERYRQSVSRQLAA
jgi:hypothetical protein